MKKTLPLIFAFFLMLLLAACDQTAETVNEKSDVSKENVEKGNNSELNLEQVMTQSTEASEKVKSFAVKMDMTQEMSIGEQKDAMDMVSTIDMIVVTDPMTLYQKMDMDMNEAGTKTAYTTETYFSPEGIFVFDSSSNQWSKFPKETSDQLMQMSDQQSNPSEELKKLEKFVDDFTFEQDADNYILTLNATGDKFTDFIKETVQGTLPQDLYADGEVFNNMKINKVKYEIIINKETMYPTTLNTVMDMELSADGETIKIKQNMEGDYSEYNKIDEVKIPQEVIDNAVEMDL
ncbi:DUF6612 family protein [Metabacillus halosaccharovorans]|uniref:DUF6612 family protein n=1 Tax=Metabacillus halosaccharovorans TaxID=930124 RepID=UPI00099564B8|nr:DUF6612 family protein [Metabacillus halosaccharovorans]